MTARSTLCLAAATLGAVVLALGTARALDTTSPTPAADSASAARAESARLRAQGRSRFVAGERRTYEVALAQALHVEGSDDVFDVQLAGTWHLTVARVTDAEVIVESALELTTVNVDGAGPGLRDELERRCWIALSPGGRVEAIELAPEVSDAARGLIRALAGATQLADGDGSGDAWSVVETSTLGDYTADYRRSGDALSKRVARFVSVTAAGVDAAAIEVDGELRATLDASGWARQLVFDQSMALPAGTLTPAVALDWHIDMSLATTREGVATTFEGGAFEALTAAATDGDAQAREDRSLVADLTWSDLLRDVMAVDVDSAEGAALVAQLQALLRVHPELAAECAAALRALDDPDRARLLVAGLGGADTAEARAELAGIATDRAIDDEVRMHGTAALGVVSSPDEGTLSALVDLLDDSTGDVRITATLAIGNAARRGVGGDAIDVLLARLDAAATLRDYIVALRALGNTGDPRALPAVERALASDSPGARAAAVEALRFVATPRAAELIGRHLAGDPSPQVRRSAVFAIGFRAIDGALLDIVRAAADGDPDEQVRAAAARVLAAAQ